MAVVIALCGLVASAAGAAEDVVIGAGFVLSGDFASHGTDARTAGDLAVDELNAAGGLLGRRLKVEYADTGADGAKAVAQYRTSRGLLLRGALGRQGVGGRA